MSTFKRQVYALGSTSPLVSLEEDDAAVAEQFLKVRFLRARALLMRLLAVKRAHLLDVRRGERVLVGHARG